jgi:hypothetical protein
MYFKASFKGYNAYVNQYVETTARDGNQKYFASQFHSALSTNFMVDEKKHRMPQYTYLTHSIMERVNYHANTETKEITFPA